MSVVMNPCVGSPVVFINRPLFRDGKIFVLQDQAAVYVRSGGMVFPLPG